MLRKPQEEPIQSPQPGNRITLPEESGIRSITGIKQLLAMAEASRGSQIELSWTTKVPGERFVLDVQWDPNQDDPFWVLYEEKNGKSKRVWDQVFAATDIELCYDILVMTCGGVDATTKNLSEILKPHLNADKEDAKGSTKSTNLVNAANANSAEKDQLGNSQAYAIPGTFPPGFMPNYMFPPGMAAMAPAMPFPMPAYAMPMPAEATANMPAAFTHSPTTNTPKSSLSSSSGGANVVEKSLLSLLIKSQVISKETATAVCRVQELIEEGRLSFEEAVLILNSHHEKGASIEECLSADGKQSSALSAKESPSNLKPLDLLTQAGIISGEDLKTAQAVTKKHGGEIVGVLKAAKKLDDKTLDAAQISCILLSEGQMKLEQSIILLNYCSRSRVSFEEAIDELGWNIKRPGGSE